MNTTRIIGWTLVHSVWQIAECGLFLLIARGVLRTARAKYVAGLIAMAGCVIAPLCTFLLLATQDAGMATVDHAAQQANLISKPMPALSAPASGPLTANDLPTKPFSAGDHLGAQFASVGSQVPSSMAPTQWPNDKRAQDGTIDQTAWNGANLVIERALPILVGVWTLGLVLMSLRLLGGLFVIRRLVSRSQECEDWVRQRVSALSEALGTTVRVSVRVSDSIESPSVVGFLRAVVLLPSSLVTGLEPELLEAILAHEIAHIARFDYVANLFQSIVETIFFYHPVVWWISAGLRAEREHCCDDAAVRIVDDRLKYARALMVLEEMRVSEPRLAMAATGGSLMRRVQRLVSTPPKGIVSPWSYVLVLVATTSSIAFAQRPTLIQLSASRSHKTSHRRIGAASTVARGHGGLTRAAAERKHEADVVTHVRVITPTGKPAAGAITYCVSADLQTFEYRKQGSTADRQGRFSIKFPAGDRALVAAFSPGVGIGAINVKAGMPTTIRLLPLRKSYVKVQNLSGRPLSHVKVAPAGMSLHQLYLVDCPLFDLMGGFTDSAGRVTLRLPEAPLRVDVTDNGMSAEPDPSGYFKLTTDRAVRLVVGPAYTVDGVLTREGAPVPRSQVLATSRNQRQGQTATTDEQGRFSIKKVPPGPATFSAFLAPSLAADWCVTPVHITVGASKSQIIHLELGHGVIWRGRVVDIAGRGVPGAEVSLSSPSEASQGPSLSADKNGAFSGHFPPGSYTAIVMKGGLSTETPVTLAPDRVNVDTLQAPPEGVQVKCKVLYGDTDKPVPGLYVQYLYNDPGDRRYEQSGAMTDDDGVARVYVPRAALNSVKFTANKGNLFSDWRVSSKNGLATLRLRPRKLTSVEGKVTDTEGRPLVGARVAIGFSEVHDFIGDMQKMGPWEKLTKADGTYRFDGIMPGIVLFTMVERHGYADAQTAAARTTASRTTTLPTMRLLPAHIVKGRVVDQTGRPIADAQVFAEKVMNVRSFSVRTGPDGTFSLDRIPPGKHRLTIYKGRKEAHVRESDSPNATYTVKL